MQTGGSGVGSAAERAGMEETTAGNFATKVVEMIADHPPALI